MIRTLNLNRQTTAILENAYAIGYEKQTNAIWSASFSLPLNDPKVDKVELLKYVEITDDDEYIGLFRIIPKLTIKNESTQEVRFQCEHVLATLLDSSLFKYHQRSNFTTESNIEYLLSKQKHKHWRKGKVEFTRYFHYSWENENLCSSIFSVPKPFDEPYIWDHDTKSYPWTLDLVKPDNEPICRIKEGYNLIGLEIEENPMSVYNRIYPLGAGEGVNQLTIESVNNGIPYIEDRKPGEEIKEYIWVDQRFTDVNSLLASAKALLKKWKEPIVTWKVSAAEVSKITDLSIDKFKVGKVVRLDIDGLPVTDLRIMKESKADIIGAPGNVELEIGNVQEDLSTTQADLERRQQINELYSQGATNILNFTYQDNCDSKIPAIIPFYIDDDVVNINTVELTFRTKKFRAYSQATKGGGALVKSTKGGGGIVKSTKGGGGTTQTTTSGGGTTRSTTSGGGSQQTSSSGGGVAKSTASGGGSSQTSNAAGTHRHRVFGYSKSNGGAPSAGDYEQFHAPRNPNGTAAGLLIIAGAPGDVYTESADGSHSHSVSIPAHTHNFEVPSHTHSVNIPAHSHDVTIPDHSHSVTVPDHTHEIDLPNHTHEIELPDHTHEVEHKIVELDTMPSKVTIKVDGNIVPHTSTSGDRINLVDYMSKDSSGKINRGRHEVQILPNGLARIEADLILRVFIQSQLGGNF
ncbi:phage tail protein [Lederbergia sp. NSJ-179]|uniref:phage tail protein n=1 Tax=Lederbergia sp. NSJ-179 TaxID=2931402 RepID=UPI001FD61FC5|nr:phage tail protein [Lederbergia sp. NSJ-179]MCJ7840498.1 phage tail protein [Lederbergia sp. NSJ-179]